MVNYLDEFLIIGSTKEECQRGLVTFINFLHYLGFNASWHKAISPSQHITFLGIELDSSTMSLRLPEDKLNHAIDPSLHCKINYLELFPVLIAARSWDSSWTNKRICVETDNTQAMVFINKGSCKNPIAMAWLRELFWLSVRHNFHLRTRHLTGINNINADRLSRLFQSWTLSNEIFSPL